MPGTTDLTIPLGDDALLIIDPYPLADSVNLQIRKGESPLQAAEKWLSREIKADVKLEHHHGDRFTASVDGVRQRELVEVKIRISSRESSMKRRMKDQPLDSFTRSYIETALWSSMDNADESGGEPLDANYSASDIDPETMAQMIADAYSFQERNAELLADSGLSDKRAGHYFWLSRNGHGSGFFDEDLDALQDAAKRYGGFDLYVGDDGVIYGSPLDQRGGGVNEARQGPATHAYVLLREVGKKKWLYLDGKGGEAATRVRAARYTIKQATEIARNIMTDNPGTWETKVLPIE